MKYIDLLTWAARVMDDPPCRATLYRWAATGKIQPAPVKLGKWRVREDARLAGDAPRPSLVERLMEGG